MRFIYLSLLALALTGCGGSDKGDGPQVPLQQAKGVIISESEKGDSRWLLKAEQATFYDTKKIVDLQKPFLEFKEEGDESVSSIESDLGHYDMQSSLITMTGNVKADSPKENAKLFTEEAFYDTENKEIFINVPVKVIRGKMTLNGAGLKASSDLSKIEVFKQEIQLPQHMKDFKESLK